MARFAWGDPGALAVALAVPPESLRAAGEERYGRQAYDSARGIWEAEVVRAQRAHDAAAEARTRMWLGLAAWRLGDYAAARREGEASLAMKRRLGMDAELSRSFNALGLLAWNEGRHGDALQHFDSAVAAARRHGDGAGIARAAANVPLVKVELGDFDGARRGLETALAAGRAVGDERTQGNALANLAMLEIRLGRPAQSLPLLARARAHYAAIDYSTGEANALGQLATAWAALGDLQRAIALADSALMIARVQGLQQEVASELEVIADLHEQAGSPRLALQRLLEADSLDTALGLAVERGVNLRRIAAILLELGEAPASAARAREALAAHVASQTGGEAVYDRLQLAQSLARDGDLRAARAEADTASGDAARYGNPSAVREAAAVAARLALDAGDPARALRVLDRTTRSGLEDDWRLADLRAEAAFALGRLDDARREGVRAVARLERERASLGVGPLRSAYLTDRTAPFSRLVAIQLARGDTAAAFGVAASVPGRALAERLGGVAGAAPAVAAMAEGERLLLRAAALERQIEEIGVEPKFAEQRDVLARALESTRAAYEEQLARRAPSPNAHMLGVSSVTLRDVQGQLAGNEALISFLVGPERIDVFVVRAPTVAHRAIRVTDGALAARVRVVRELLGGRRSPAALAALGELHELLLGPAKASGAMSGATRLRIVPHGVLAALPFAALRDPHTGRFVAEDYVVSYLPSAAALAVRRAPIGGASRAMAVFAPLPDSLPGTGREARAVARLALGAQLWLGSASTEATVRAALDEGRAVHVASHGALNAQNPLFSRMVVGARAHGDTSATGDGQLEVHEILALRTASPLVFLSGCETGLGAGDSPFASGADEGSLAQAFLVAGVGSVVATLWRVDDADAVQVAAAFYRQLGAGAAPEDALTLAQREAIRTPSGGFTWAAYEVSATARANPPGVSVKLRTNP